MSNSEIEGRDVARSSLWSAGGQIAALAVSFVATPFTVRLLGPAAYGVLAIVTAAISYVSVLDLGMGSASTKLGASALTRGDAHAESVAVWTAAVITLVPTTATAIVAWLLAPQIASDVLHTGSALRGDATWALRLASIAFVARVLASVLNTPLVVRLRWGPYTIATGGAAVLQSLFIPVVVAFGGGVVAATGVIVGASLISLVFIGIVAVRLQPAVATPAFQARAARSLVGFGGALLVGNVAGIVLANTERFILAGSASIRDVAYYSVAANFAALIALVPIAVSQPLFPAFGRLAEASGSQATTDLYERSLSVILALVLPVAVILAVIGRPFLDAWAGSGFGRFGIVPLRILLVGLVLNSLTFVPLNLLLGRGRSGTVARCRLVELPLYPIYAFVLIHRAHINGAATVWAVHAAIETTLAFGAARRLLPGLPSLRSIVRPLATSLACLLMPLIVEAVRPDGVIAFGALAVGVVAYSWTMWAYGLREADKAIIWSILPERLNRVGRSAAVDRPESA